MGKNCTFFLYFDFYGILILPSFVKIMLFQIINVFFRENPFGPDFDFFNSLYF